jgi:hypothetical protein
MKQLEFTKEIDFSKLTFRVENSPLFPTTETLFEVLENQLMNYIPSDASLEELQETNFLDSSKFLDYYRNLKNQKYLKRAFHS